MTTKEESLKDAFERLDVDSTGFISRDNLKAVLGKTYDNSLIDKMLKVRRIFIAARGESTEYSPCRLASDVGTLFLISSSALLAVAGSAHPALASSVDPLPLFPASLSPFVRRQEGDSSLSGSIEWEDFLAMMKPVVVEEYRKEAEAMLRDTPAACREAAEVTCRGQRAG